jgi:RNA polymerase sigma-B factor
LLAAQCYHVDSIDAPVAGGGGARTVCDTIAAVDGEFDRTTDLETVRPLLAALSERRRTVLYLRFFESMTQSQIADRIGVSQMQVSRILEQTLREIREQL